MQKKAVLKVSTDFSEQPFIIVECRIVYDEKTY